MTESGLADWLLEARTPSIRYLTLRNLMGLPESHAAVSAARREIMASGPVPAILAGQTSGGRWAGERSYYTPKFRSTHWSMLLLAELAADGADPRLQSGAAFMLDATADELQHALVEGKGGLSCFWGNLLRYVLHCGMASDPRAPRVVQYVVCDAQTGWQCRHNWGLPCAWGAARGLWGLALLPPEHRTAQVEAAIASGIDFLLGRHSLVAADYPAPKRVHPLWFRLNFPLFYHADILFVLRVLAELGALDRAGVQPALEWLTGLRLRNGRWRGTSPFRGRTWEGWPTAKRPTAGSPYTPRQC